MIQRTTAWQPELSILVMFGLLVPEGVQLTPGNQPVIAVPLAWYPAELLRRWEELAGAKTR